MLIPQERPGGKEASLRPTCFPVLKRRLIPQFSFAETAPLISFAPHMILHFCFIGCKTGVGSWLLVPIADCLHPRTSRELKRIGD